MGTILVCILLGIIIPIISIDEDPSDKFFGCVVGFFMGLIIGFVIALAIPCDTKKVSTYKNLVSIQDNGSIEGSFFLGSGSVNGVMVYTYYYQQEDGSYKMDQVKFNKASIRYTDERPMLEKIVEKTDSNWFLAMKNIEYVIHIPKGSIRQNYILDAK